MRILYVSYMHPAVTPGGAQQVAHEMLLAARARGHEAFMIAALEAEQDSQYGKPGAPIVPMPGEKGQYFYFPQGYDFIHLSVSDWRSLRFFRELVEMLQPDVIHFHHYHRVGVESIRAARLAAPDAKIVLTLHEMLAICLADGQMVRKGSRDLCRVATPIDCHRCFPDLRPEFFVLRAERLKAALDDCDAYIFPTEFIADRYKAWGLDAARCHVVPNGQIHPAPEAPRDRHSPQVNRFGYFGQFVDNKGIDVVLEALLLLARDGDISEAGIEFVINGGNRHYASEDYLAKVDGLIDTIRKTAGDRIRIREPGRYGRDELAARMSDVDWVIAPSTWWEVFGLVVSEAWMFGRPVIVSDIAGLGERVKNGVNGFTFPARNASALAAVISTLTGDVREWKRARARIPVDGTNLDMFDGCMAAIAHADGPRFATEVT
jgi:glycosyltransferase involved in cell wall biosynthesis